MKKLLWAAAAATAFISTAALASVSFDPSTGYGFVGKGDVQLAFGWNNKAAQDNAGAVSFTYNAKDTYDVECEWTTVTGGPNSKTIVHDITVPRHVSVSSSIVSDPRKTGQYTGYNLTGLANPVVEGTVPEVGGTCPGASNVGAIITVVQQTGSAGGLYANYGGNSVLLNWPTV